SSRSSFNPASVTAVLLITNLCKLFNSFSSFSPASLILVSLRSRPTTGLQGSLSSLVTRPPSFSIIFTAAASSARPATARASSPTSTAAPTAPRCRAMIFSPRATVPRFNDAATAPSVQGKRARPAWVGLVADTSAAEGSAKNLQSMQCCLEFLYPHVRDLGVSKAQGLQALEFLQLLQSRVGNHGVQEVQRLQALEFLQFLQPRIRDLGAAEVHEHHGLARSVVIPRDPAPQLLDHLDNRGLIGPACHDQDQQSQQHTSPRYPSRSCHDVLPQNSRAPRAAIGRRRPG